MILNNTTISALLNSVAIVTRLIVKYAERNVYIRLTIDVQIKKIYSQTSTNLKSIDNQQFRKIKSVKQRSIY